VLASVVALKLPTIVGVTQFVAIFVSAVAGGIISMLPVLLYRYTKVNPIVSAIMFNSIFYYGGAYIVSTFLLERSGTWGSHAFPKEAKLGLMIPKSKMHWGALILLIVYLGVVYLMRKTALGMKIRTVGLNPTFATNVGLNSGFLGGSIAGMGGAIEMLGMYQRFLWQGPVNYVWDGLMVHMLANGNPAFIPVTAIFIAFLRIGSEIMSRSTNIPPEVVAFLQGIVIVLVASSKFLYGFKAKYDRKISLAQVRSDSEGEFA
jgi:simple sugar transport system permease protein